MPHSESCAAWCFGLVTAVVLLIHFSTKYGLNDTPSATGDEPSYDSIGWQLSHGHGFAEDYTDPEFRRPYDEAARRLPKLMTLPYERPGTTALRPPLFPLVMAVADWCFGRQFYAIRTINVLVMAFTGAMIVRHLLKHDGLFAACLAGLLFLVVDVRTRLYARAILTESLAAGLTALMTLLLLQLLERRQWRTAVFCGLVIGCAMLNRSAVLLWLPGLAFGCVLMLSRRRSSVVMTSEQAAERSSGGTPSPLILMLVMLSVAGLTYLPWAIRNTVVLDRFMPLGTQGLIELSAGYSDLAYERQGVWFLLDSIHFFDDLNTTGMSGIDRERARAEWSRDKARQWMRANPSRLLPLAAGKVIQEYRPRLLSEWILGLLMVIGVLTSWRRQDTQLLVLLHLVNAFGIAATWSVEGRFLVPLLFSIHVLAARGTAGVWQLLCQRSLFVRRQSPDQPVG